MTRLRLLVIACALFAIPGGLAAEDTTASAATAARADIQKLFGFVPTFLKDMPDLALPGAWEEMKTLQMNPSTALPPKIKEMIGLAVAAQVPCHYCTYAHTEFAKLDGATDAELGEAVVLAALTRHWSTVLQGQQTDITKFRADIAEFTAYAKKMMAGQTPPPKPINVVDAASATQDIQQSWGMVPDFIKKFPQAALAGAWKEERDVEMNPHTALSDKHKSLIGLAVAAQIPCRFCVVADTEFARLAGATDQEISEAIAMSALTRHWSTYLNGMQIDEPTFRKDISHLVKNVKKQMASQAQSRAPSSPSASDAKVAVAANGGH